MMLATSLLFLSSLVLPSSLYSARAAPLERRLMTSPYIFTNCNHDLAITWDKGMANYLNTFDIFSGFGAGEGTYSQILGKPLSWKTTFTTYGLNPSSSGSVCIYDDNYSNYLYGAWSTGHQVASSGWTGADLSTLTTDQIDEEIGRLNDAFARMLGVTPKFYYPPTGTLPANIANYLYTKFGMYTILPQDKAPDSTGSESDNNNWLRGFLYDNNAYLAEPWPAHMVLAHADSSAMIKAIPDYGIFAEYGSYDIGITTVASCLDKDAWQTVPGKTPGWQGVDCHFTCDGPYVPMSSEAACPGSGSSSTTTATDINTSATTTSQAACSTYMGSYFAPAECVNPSTTTTTSDTTIPTPSDLASYDTWTYTGCFVDSVAARTLPNAQGLPGGTGAVTVEACLDACAAGGFKYAGLEWSQECYCGNTIPPEEATDGRCDMVCSGNPLEICGGPVGLSVYENTSSQQPINLPTYNDWSYSNCYTDSVEARVLPNQVDVPGGAAAMTVELCLDACHSAGYNIAGLEWSQECYCGTALPTEIAADNTCNMKCNGNSLEVCGGGNGLSVYKYSSALSAYNDWTAEGCYEDSVAARVLPIVMGVSGGADAMTIEKCLDACSAAGYAFAGVEWARECYCGTVLPSTLATDNRCDMACTGNALETCGGGDGINVYSSSATTTTPSILQSYGSWSYTGCFEDILAARTMPIVVDTITTASMTVEKCLDACNALGHNYGGLEWSQECYCADALPPTPATDGRCDMVCNGDHLEYCGGGNGLTVYTYSTPASTTAPSTTSQLPPAPPASQQSSPTAI